MIEAIAPQFNTLLLFVVIGLQLALLLRKNGSGRMNPLEWERRIKSMCRQAIREEKAGLPFVELHGDR